MKKPIIGITFHGKIKDTYGWALTETGGVPLYLGPGAPVEEVLRSVSGIIFSGGGDIWPKFFGEAFTVGSKAPDMARDCFELALAREGEKQQIPMMGICRGMQIINVALGGSIFQDIGLKHCQRENPLRTTHEVTIVDPSFLRDCFETDNIMVNSFHHQSVKVIAPLLRLAAYSPDGVIEALEGNNIWGVQWHPEWLIQREGEKKLFAAFVGLCREYNDNSQKS